MNNRTLGMISLVIFIIGWLLYAKVGIIISLICELIALISALISDKKEKNVFSKIAFFGSIILIIMMIIVIVGKGVVNKTGQNELINRSRQIQNVK